MFQFHDWVLVKLVRSCKLVSTILARYVIWSSWGLWFGLDTSTWSYWWLGLIVILDDVATNRVVARSLIELHIELSLHVCIFFLLSCSIASLIYFHSCFNLLNIWT
jgi:hypothetical protein